MVVPSAGSVVLVPFPFSDLSQSKLRATRQAFHRQSGTAGFGGWRSQWISVRPLGIPVDVLTPKALPDGFRERVLAEAVPV